MDVFGIKKFAYISFGLGVLLFFITFFTTFSLLVLMIGLAMIFGSAVILKVGDWIIPSFLYRFKVHPVFANMIVRDDAVVVRGEKYYAVGGAELLVTRSIAELSDKEKEALILSWHSFLSSVRFPFKIITIMKPVDVSKEFSNIIREIETAKIKIAKARKNMDRYTEITYEQRLKELERIANRFRAETPHDTIFLISVQGEGFTEEDAVAVMKQRLKELMTAISVSLSVEARELKGVELLKLMDLHLLTPERFEDYMF